MPDQIRVVGILRIWQLAARCLGLGDNAKNQSLKSSMPYLEVFGLLA